MTDYPKVSSGFSKRVKPGWKYKIIMFAAVIGTVSLAVSFIGGDLGLYRMWTIDRRIDRLKQDIKLLKVQRNDILWETDKMKNDPEYIQRYAVETYGYARPEHIIIQFVPADSTGRTRGAAQMNGRSANGPIQNRSIHHTD